MNNESLLVEFQPYMNRLLGGSLEEKIKIAIALELFLHSKITIETAARLAGQSNAYFTELSRNMMVSWIK